MSTKTTRSRDAARDALWVTASLILARVFGFATSVVAARLLSVPDMAAYLVAISVAVVLIPVADLGHWPLVSRSAAQSSTAAPRLSWLRASARARGPYWIVLILLGTLIALAAGVATPVVAVALVSSAIGQVLVDAAAGELFGRRAFRSGALVRVLPALAGLLATSGLVFAGASFEHAVVGFALSRVVPGLILLAWSKSARDLTQITLWSGAAFAGTTVLMTIYTRSDLLLLQAYRTDALVVAQYGIAYSILIALQVLPSSLATAMFPRLAGSGSSKGARAESALLVAVLGLATAGPIAALAWLASPLLMTLFGSAYSKGIGDVAPLFLTLTSLTVGQVAVSALQAMGFERVALRATILVAVINISGNTVLIPLMGVSGAVLATLTAETALAALTLFVLVKVANRGRALVAATSALPITLLLDPSGWVSAAYVTVLALLLWARNSFGITSTMWSIATGAKSAPRP